MRLMKKSKIVLSTALFMCTCGALGLPVGASGNEEDINIAAPIAIHAGPGGGDSDSSSPSPTLGEMIAPRFNPDGSLAHPPIASAGSSSGVGAGARSFSGSPEGSPPGGYYTGSDIFPDSPYSEGSSDSVFHRECISDESLDGSSSGVGAGARSFSGSPSPAADASGVAGEAAGRLPEKLGLVSDNVDSANSGSPFHEVDARKEEESPKSSLRLYCPPGFESPDPTPVGELVGAHLGSNNLPRDLAGNSPRTPDAVCPITVAEGSGSPSGSLGGSSSGEGAGNESRSSGSSLICTGSTSPAAAANEVAGESPSGSPGGSSQGSDSEEILRGIASLASSPTLKELAHHHPEVFSRTVYSALMVATEKDGQLSMMPSGIPINYSVCYSRSPSPSPSPGLFRSVPSSPLEGEAECERVAQLQPHKCNDLAELKNILEQYQKEQGLQYWVQPSSNDGCYVYWYNTQLPTKGIGYQNCWYGDNLPEVLPAPVAPAGTEWIAVQDKVAILLPTRSSCKHQCCRVPMNRSALSDVILEVSNWRYSFGHPPYRDPKTDLYQAPEREVKSLKDYFERFLQI